MKRSILRWASALLLASGLTTHVRGATINNTFDAQFNYVFNGIIGDSSWDGVYLGLGDVANGNAGGSPNGTSQQANTTDFPGFLGLTTSGTDWSGAGDDGFFLYRVVAGDFDMSVQIPSPPPYDNRGANFEGLMVRAYNTNNTGIPFSTTTTNMSENWLALLRMQQFGDDGEIRQANNAANQEFTFPGNNADVNTPRWLRITRTGNLINFYWKTNDTDPWFPITNAAGMLGSNSVNRADWNGIALQVGIQASAFSTAQRNGVFDNFQLIATNVTIPASVPNPPSNIIEVSSNITGSATISWTPGAGADGSLVLVRQNGPLISQPVQGINYLADTNFANTNTLLSAGRAHVVYVGSGNSVTIGGLGGTNNTYQVAVFSYSGSGPSIVYNRDAVATNAFIGPGQVSNVVFTLNPPNIPVGGAAVAQVTATYTSGDSYDVSSDLSTVWVSTDPTVALAGSGVVTAITNGTTTITATYAGVTGTNTATVVTPAFVDNFDVNQNYVTNGVLGSRWDGVYLGAGDVPFQIPANLASGPGVVSLCDANVTTNGQLNLIHNQTGWEGNENDGFFLFKYVPGDFQTAVHIEGYDISQFQIPGLMARQFAPGGGPAGTANGTFTHGRENHMRWGRFDEFTASTVARRNLNGGTLFHDTADGETSDYWLLMIKSGTTFTFYKRANPTDPWQAVPGSTQTLANTTNPVMQVGIGASTFNSGTNFLHAAFSHFMLDATNLLGTGTPPPAATGTVIANNPDGSLTLNWTPGAGSAGSLVVLRAGRLVNVKPAFGTNYTASSVFGQGSDLGSGNFVVYAGTGNTVTVTGLVPGTTYYAAVFSFSGSGATTSYNTAGATQTSVQALGIVQSLTVNLPQGNTLVNGGVLPFTVIANYQGGVSNDVTTQVILPTDPTNGVVGTNGFLTGLSNGVASLSVTFQSVTTNLSVTVRPPRVTDDFSVPFNYLNGSVQGTIWDGVYLGSSSSYLTNTVPNSAGSAQTLIADADTTTNGVLVVQSTGTDWGVQGQGTTFGASGDNGFLLWRYVGGDFQAAVQVASIDKNANGTGSIGFDFSGLMARAYGGTNDMTGMPYNNAENWVYIGEFEQFGDSTESRHALNGADNEVPLGDGATNDFRLLMRKQGGVFTFFRRVNTTDPWVFLPNQTITRNDLANLPLQVGVFQSMYSGATGTVTFDDFMLDDSLPKMGASGAAGNLSVTYPAIPILQVQSSGSLVPGNWQPVAGTTGQTNGVSTLSTPINPTNQFFRLAR